MNISEKLSAIWDVKKDISSYLTSYGYIVTGELSTYTEKYLNIADNNTFQTESKYKIRIQNDGDKFKIYDATLLKGFNRLRIDWGDGIVSSEVKTDDDSGMKCYSHIYQNSGIYNLNIYNSISSILFRPTTDKTTFKDTVSCLTEIDYGQSMKYQTTIYQLQFASSDISSIDFINDTNISSIESMAFRRCKKLKSVDLCGIYSTKNSVFEYCTSIETANVPNLKRIEDYVFRGCSKLSTINCPNVTSLGNMSLNSTAISSLNCNSLSSVGQSAMSSTKIKTFPQLSALTRIEGNSFSNNPLISVDLHNAEYIGTDAFKRCYSMQTVVMPKAKIIENQAFQFNTSLVSVDMTDYDVVTLGIPNLRSISAFNSCNNTYKIVIPNEMSSEWITESNWDILAEQGHISAKWQVGL